MYRRKKVHNVRVVIPKQYLNLYHLHCIIQIVENNIYRDRITLVNEETSHTFTIDPAKKYRYIVKLVGTFTEENQETGRTSTVTSEGVIVNVE